MLLPYSSEPEADRRGENVQLVEAVCQEELEASESRNKFFTRTRLQGVEGDNTMI